MQPSIPPLPKLDLTGQTALITGATSGIGLSLAHHLLTLSLSTLIIPARNVAKGEAIKQQLRAKFPNAAIHILKFDAEDLSSIKPFVEDLERKFDKLDFVYLNAGVITYAKELTNQGVERNIQINYLANVLLTILLLPLLQRTAERNSKPSRLIWTSSVLHATMSTLPKSPPPAGTSVVNHLSTIKDPGTLARNANSKILGIFFLRALTRQLPKESNVTITSFCPGTVRTHAIDSVPIYLRVLIMAFQRVYGRDADTGARVGVHAGLTTGKEAHGEFWQNNGINK